MKKFIVKSLLFLLPYLMAYVAIFLFNFKVDALCIFSRAQVLERITDNVLSGKIVAGQPYFQFRLFQKLIIKKKKVIPHTIALGSSPTLVLRAPHLGLDQKSFFNHSVPVAVTNDFIAIVGCYKKRGALPETIIIGLHPYMFSKKLARYERWKFVANDYYYLLTLMKGDMSQLQIFYELIKAYFVKLRPLVKKGYVIANYNYFKEVRKKGFDYRTVEKTAIDDWLIAPDGSLHYPFRLRFQDDSITQKKIQRYLNYQIKNRGQITFQKTFISFIDYLQSNDSQIVFFLPPYHPGVYQELKEKGELKFIVEAEEMLRSLAQSRKITVFGSYDPSCFGFSSRDFFDAVHAHDYVVKEIFKGYQEVARE